MAEKKKTTALVKKKPAKKRKLKKFTAAPLDKAAIEVRKKQRAIQLSQLREDITMMTARGASDGVSFMYGVVSTEDAPLSARIQCANNLAILEQQQKRMELACEAAPAGGIRIEIGPGGRALLSASISACDSYVPEAEQHSSLPPEVRQNRISGESIDIVGTDIDKESAPAIVPCTVETPK